MCRIFEQLRLQGETGDNTANEMCHVIAMYFSNSHFCSQNAKTKRQSVTFSLFFSIFIMIQCGFLYSGSKSV
jgi:hypothetical protein